MKILVFIKQVPDTDDVKLDPKTGNLQRDGVKSILNPLDANSIECALQLKEKYGGTVAAVTMGPPQAEDVLKKALALGCDEAYLLSDRAFGGADTLATSYTLAKAAEKICNYDLLLFGKHAVDGDTAQTGNLYVVFHRFKRCRVHTAEKIHDRHARLPAGNHHHAARNGRAADFICHYSSSFPASMTVFSIVSHFFVCGKWVFTVRHPTFPSTIPVRFPPEILSFLFGFLVIK